MSKLVRESLNEQFHKGKDPYKKYKIGKAEYLKKRYNKEDYDWILYEAVKDGSLDDVKTALREAMKAVPSERKVEHEDFLLQDALILASFYGHFDIVQYLVEEQNVDLSRGYEAVRAAADEGNLEIIKYLVQNDANFNEDAIEEARESGHEEVVQYLESKAK